MDLYDKVVKLVDGTEGTLNGDYCSKISMMDERMSEDIYILILQHFTSNNKGFKQALIEGKETPYNGKIITKDGKGLNFKVNHIPEDLQRIIVRYLMILSN